MAKALIGHLPTDHHGSRLSAENAHLRRRVRDLEALVTRLQEENDRLAELRSAELLVSDLHEMQPA